MMLDVTYTPLPHRDPPCAACGRALGERMTTVFWRGEMVHSGCWATWVLDPQARAHAVRRAQAIRTLTGRLLDQVSHELRRRVRWVPLDPPAGDQLP